MSRRSLLLFDVDGTLTKSRNQITDSMKEFMLSLCDRISVGLVGGSDLNKITEQLGSELVHKSDYAFGENGCVALRKGQQFHEESISQALGEDTLKRFINFCLHYIADLDIPIKRGTFIEYRKGMLNVSPIGRNCSQKERDEFFEYDNQHKIRETFRQVLTDNFSSVGMQFSIGGQISIDAFPTGWDKTHCLRHLEEFDDIYFFGDRTQPGGNDYELFASPRTKSFTVTGPEDTQKFVLEVLKDIEKRES